jgi:transcriptional regulator with GAF, ATPase, and Fis domain
VVYLCYLSRTMKPQPSRFSVFDRPALREITADPAMFDLQDRVEGAIRELRSAEAIAAKLLECLLSVIPAQRGAVLLASSGPSSGKDALIPVAFMSSSFDVDLDAARRVVQDRIPLFTEHAPSRLCVPLGPAKKCCGVIYLEHLKAGAFTTRHLQMLMAMAAEAAVPIVFGATIDGILAENTQLSQYVYADEDDEQPVLIGDSPNMQQLRGFVDLVAPAESSVLILGEMGTGKELVAQGIHRGSRRGQAKRPFVAVNCGAIPAGLIESELFGHERGAFSGANALKRGKFELAHGGTLFLDEIGELKHELQSVLLRVLQEREFQRVGGAQTISADVRIVAATNRDLQALVDKGEFRGDLFYRLNVIQCRTPSLREIRDDIPLLAAHFMKKFRFARLTEVLGISPEALDLLMRHDWPGNTRELQNAIERAMVVGRTEWIQPEDLAIRLKPESKRSKRGMRKSVDEIKETALREALREAQGRVAVAAKLLKMTERHVRRLIKDFGIDIREYRPVKRKPTA